MWLIIFLAINVFACTEIEIRNIKCDARCEENKNKGGKYDTEEQDCVCYKAIDKPKPVNLGSTRHESLPRESKSDDYTPSWRY